MGSYIYYYFRNSHLLWIFRMVYGYNGDGLWLHVTVGTTHKVTVLMIIIGLNI